MKDILIKTRLWHPRMTAKLFFKNMPYLPYNFIESDDPDYIMCQTFRPPDRTSGATKIFFGVENMRPDMSRYDWGFGFPLDRDIGDPRYLRLPNYVRLGAGEDLIKDCSRRRAQQILKRKTGFCAFICFNGSVRFRNLFFKKLFKYRHIAAPGKVFNNMSFIDGSKDLQALERTLKDDFYGKFQRKIEFLKRYKFVIAFENEQSVGYTSERLYHAFKADCIPIYWGNPEVGMDFNTSSFLNFYDYGSVDALIDRIIQIDKNDDLYLDYLQRPWYIDNKPNRFVNRSRILQRFKEIFG